MTRFQLYTPAGRHITCIFTILFRTGSSKVVNVCQVSFGFFLAESQILIRTASFWQKFIVSENSQRMLSVNDARRQLHKLNRPIFTQFGDNIQTARQRLYVANYVEKLTSSTKSEVVRRGPSYAPTVLLTFTTNFAGSLNVRFLRYADRRTHIVYSDKAS